MKLFILFFILRLPVVFVLDMLLGDPDFITHPVVYIGRLVSWCEKKYRSLFPVTEQGEFFAGVLTVCTVCMASCAVPFIILAAIVKISVVTGSFLPMILFFAADVFWGYQALAGRTLENEALNVYNELNVSLERGRAAVSRIVGRDVSALDSEGVIKACVETVAENTTDGITSAIIAYTLGGAPLVMVYKAINTMDSMIGYKNTKYFYFGKCAARLDDAANFIPARVAALFMIITSFILCPFKIGGRRFYPVNAVKVFFKDRYKHASPNSAQTESVCAGALGIQLAGDAVYEGRVEKKPYLGKAVRAVEAEDIIRSVVLMQVSSALTGIAIIALLIKFFF